MFALYFFHGHHSRIKTKEKPILKKRRNILTSKRKTISIILDIAIAACAYVGTILALVYAESEGYSHWYKRLLYFTQQSNLWTGTICIIKLASLMLSEKTGKDYYKRWIFILKFAFTVSSSITAIIFCSFLAPFADFNVWTAAGIITHTVVPALAIIDLFVDGKDFIIKGAHVFITLIPPLMYFIMATNLSILGVDFGRGDPFPYFFLNFHSEVGLFGFAPTSPPQIGSFYWIVFICGLVVFIAWIFAKLRNRMIQNGKNATN